MFVLIGIITVVVLIWAFVGVENDLKIQKKGIVADAVVTRVEMGQHTEIHKPEKENLFVRDEEERIVIDYTYYVSYMTRDGIQVEAKLGSKRVEKLNQGDRIRIKYLPRKTNYVLEDQG